MITRQTNAAVMLNPLKPLQATNSIRYDAQQQCRGGTEDRVGKVETEEIEMKQKTSEFERKGDERTVQKFALVKQWPQI